MPDSDPKKSRPTDEPDTYELDLDESDEAAAPPPKPKPNRSPQRSEAAPTPPSSESGDADALYDLAEPEPESRSSSAPPTLDPRLDRDAVPPAPTDSAPPPEAATDRPIPKQYQTEGEPAYVDPEVAASRREQARIRAAEQLALEHERKQKIRLIMAGIIVVIAVIALCWWYVFLR